MESYVEFHCQLCDRIKRESFTLDKEKESLVEKYKSAGWSIRPSGDLCPTCSDDRDLTDWSKTVEHEDESGNEVSRIFRTFDPEEGTLPGDYDWKESKSYDIEIRGDGTKTGEDKRWTIKDE